MSERFYLESPPVDGRALLTAEEARHLARVLRAQVGEEVTLFDGQGGSWLGRIERIDRDAVTLAVGPRSEAVDPPLRLTIAAALPKGERQKWMVEKLTELGCGRLLPLDTARSVAEGTAAAVARLRRSGIEACKQCGRDRLMAIDESRGLAALIAAGRPAGGVAVVADPAGTDSLAASLPPTGEVLAVIGPEGGLDEAERAALNAAGFRRISLGPHVLRIETAAVAVAALVAAAGQRGA